MSPGSGPSANCPPLIFDGRVLRRSGANHEVRGQGDDHATRECDDWSHGRADAHVFSVLRLERWKLGDAPLVGGLVEVRPDVADKIDGAIAGQRQNRKNRHRRKVPEPNRQRTAKTA